MQQSCVEMQGTMPWQLQHGVLVQQCADLDVSKGHADA